MDSDAQINVNPVEQNIDTMEEIKDENKKTENIENSEQSNVIDVIGNGQLVKKVCYRKNMAFSLDFNPNLAF